MNRTLLALLLTIALAGTAASAPDRTNPYHDSASAAASSKAGSFSVARGFMTNLAASSILSWTQKLAALLDPRFVEKGCLAGAVYFEARSESRQGQLAVAMVILNRVKRSNYPPSICGVVYQGASRLNACQFSFACDGKPDFPKPGRAWEAALAVTALALAGELADKEMQILSTATHFHADYVQPHWSKSFQRLAKIGRHIFYSQG